MLELFADDSAMAFSVGQAYFMLGSDAQALEYLEKALNVGEDKANALMMLSLVHGEKGDSVRARELHEQAIAIDPASEGTYQAFKNL